MKKTNLPTKHGLKNELRHINKIASFISEDDMRNRHISMRFSQQLMNSGPLTNSNKVHACPKMASVQKFQFLYTIYTD